MKAEVHSQGVVSTSWEMLEAKNASCLFPSLPYSEDIGACIGCCPSDTLLATSLRLRLCPSPSLVPQSTHVLECLTQHFLSPPPLPVTGQGWQCCSGVVSWAWTWTYLGSVSVSFPWRYFSTFPFMIVVDEILWGAISSRNSGSNAVSLKNVHGVSGRVCRAVLSS